MNIVLDTNVLVSALWSSDSKPDTIVNATISQKFSICYGYRILNEYTRVLHRPKSAFSDWQVEWVLKGLTKNGCCVVPDPLPDISFTDESDRKFLEVARFCFAPPVTGDIKHYPSDPEIISVADFYKRYFEK